jgi:hypothetical protein
LYGFLSIPTAVDREVYDPYNVEMNQRRTFNKRSSGVLPVGMAENSFGWSPQYWLIDSNKQLNVTGSATTCIAFSLKMAVKKARIALLPPSLLNSPVLEQTDGAQQKAGAGEAGEISRELS